MTFLLATFFDLTSGDIASTTGYAGGFLRDFWPLLAIFIGLGIAGIIWNFLSMRK